MLQFVTEDRRAWRQCGTFHAPLLSNRSFRLLCWPFSSSIFSYWNIGSTFTCLMRSCSLISS